MFKPSFFHRIAGAAARTYALATRAAVPLAISGPAVASLSSPLLRLPATQSHCVSQAWRITPQSIEPAEPRGLPEDDSTMHMDSVLRKRRLKMKKHKLRKRRRLQRALKKRLGKI